MSATTVVIGNTTSDIELRFTNSGKAVGNVTVAVSDRRLDKSTNEWVDGDTWFARCTLWGELAENAAGSLMKGTRVIGQGRIVQRDWEDKDSNKRTSVEVTVDAIGPDLRYASATVVKAQSRESVSVEPQADVWTTSQAGFDESTPF